ncbi:MAG TPA: class I SAM-dependent methyltransferase [Blastocatellia bacterium]|nr:class I SAM-dependent methyltransferase [Blastocatellia bacterium]
MQTPYDYIAEKWHSNGRDQAYINRALAYVDKILEGVPPRAKVLDLGCGTGYPIAQHIVQQGYQVVGVDESEEMLKIAKRLVPEADFIQSDMVAVKFDDRFAAAVAWDSVFHVERKHHASVYQNICRSLEPGARLLLSVGASDPSAAAGAGAEGFTSEMFGHNFFYSGYEPGIARQLLEDAGFEIELWELDDPSSLGHIAVIARKNDYAL